MRSLNGQPLHAGDGAAVSTASGENATAAAATGLTLRTDASAELLLFDLP